MPPINKNLIPLLLFILSYVLIQLFHYDMTVFIYIVSSLLFFTLVWQWIKWSSRENEWRRLTAIPLIQLTNVQLHQLLKEVFRRQGYQVEENQGIAAFILMKRKKKTSVFIHHSEVTSPTIQQLINFNQNKNLTNSVLVSIEGFSLSTKKLAKANRITLINTEILQALTEHLNQSRLFFRPATKKQQHSNSSQSIDS
ncbi:restriction endonuclease [Alkalihalobacillus pseudalcaliphilus]|uniref:restriction endonuclease n=1 Tax=Alkalihalobacillus pseudalcaliphilus TaxID=79884 RepID=UPI00064DB5EA|nr:restriction endonuclease [Alkalihalobacillus pseudalcaliphilus]KMK77755.1 hypothetical protein AB990_04690 [Alkalihalobacillus pseudalcaliphilus]